MPGVDALRHQVGRDALGAALRELEVLHAAAGVVRVAVDEDRVHVLASELQVLDQQVELPQAFEAAGDPVKTFMLSQVDREDLALFVRLSKIERPATIQDTPIRVVTPAFMISELKRAFEIGFLLFVPFLVIDLVVASVLMSMGMMMLPPVVVSLPFKLIFFVLVDGWRLVAGSLVESFKPG